MSDIEYGFSEVDFQGIEIPVYTFGGGNITVTSAFSDGDGFSGIALSKAPNKTKIGEYANHGIAGGKMTEIPDLHCYLRFDNVESVDIVIAKLNDAKAHMNAMQQSKQA